MSNAENIWNVIAWYFGSSVVIAAFLILMTVHRAGRKKENRNYAAFCIVMGLLLWNNVTYGLIKKLGEGDTYYRFLWVFPVALFLAYFLMEGWDKIRSSAKRAVFAVMAVFIIFLYSGSTLKDWVTLPENIYQLSDDKIELCDLIDEVSGGERVVVYGEDDLLYGVREYNANICKATEGEKGYLYYLITENEADASGQLMLGILVNARIDYIAVRKEYTAAQAALSGGGCAKAGETENYYLYYADQEVLRADLQHIYDNDWNTAAGVIGIENVMIKGVNEEQQFLFYGDGKLEEFTNAAGESVMLTDGNGVFYSKEYEKYIVCCIDNKNHSVSEKVTEKLEAENKKGKPIILMLQRPVTPENDRDGLYAFLQRADSNIRTVYANQASEYKKTMLTEHTVQYSIASDSGSNALLIQVRGE